VPAPGPFASAAAAAPDVRRPPAAPLDLALPDDLGEPDPPDPDDPPEPDPDAPEPGGLMPAPKSAPSRECEREEDTPPVALAWLKGRAYSFAAGDPGSTCTPGSRPLPLAAAADPQMMESTISAAMIDTPMARMVISR
jgi:hypothetical protein